MGLESIPFSLGGWQWQRQRGRDTDIGFETLKPRDRKRQIHGRLFPLVTWALLTTHYPMTKTKQHSHRLSLSFSLSLLPFHLTPFLHCYSTLCYAIL